jgi:HEAT repeat protein/predicted Zn-dependent protease
MDRPPRLPLAALCHGWLCPAVSWAPHGRTSRPWHLVPAALLLALLAPSVLRADLIVLRNGQELRGRVHSRGEQQVRIELEVGGTVVVDRGDIARTEVDAPAAASEAAAVSPEAMARLEAREKVHVLIEALGSEKEPERLAAERELGAVGRAALPLLRPLLDEGSPPQRLGVLRVLTALGDSAVLPQVRGILSNPKDKPLHLAAAKALADLGGPRMAPELTALLVNTDDDEVAAVCLKALAAMRSPFAAPFVVEAAQRPALRPVVWAALARWGDPVLLPYLLPRLEKAANDETRERLAGWVADLLTPGHVAALSKLLDTYEKDKPVAKLLVAAVQRLHKDYPGASDVALLSATQPEIRKAAHESLKREFRVDRPAQPNAWQTEFQQATRARLLLVPVGRGALATAQELDAALSKALSHPVTVASTAEGLAGTESEPFDARRLLLALDRRQMEDFRSLRVIGVVAAEVSAPGLEHALAPTRPGGSIALSLAPLGRESLPGRATLQRSRALRLALHALARSFDLPACGAAACPSAPVYQARDLDALQPHFCPACAKAFEQAWEAEAEAVAFRYGESAKKLSQLAGKSPDAHAAVACMFERGLDVAGAQREWKACLDLETDKAAQALVQRRIEFLARQAAPVVEPPPKKKGKGG